MQKISILLIATYLFYACTSKNSGEPDDSGLYIKLIGGGRGEKINDAVLMPNGELIGVGSSRSFSTLGVAQNHIFVFKTDAQGNKIWQKAIEGTTDNTIEANSINIQPDGKLNILATSYSTTNLPITKRMTLIKASAEGIKENLQDFVAISTHDVFGVATQAKENGSLMILGKRQEKGNVDIIPTENYIARINPSLNTDFEKIYASEAFKDNTPYTFERIRDDEFLIGGSVNFAPRLILIDDELGIKWDYSYKTAITQGAIHDIAILPAGYLATGISISNSVNGVTRPFLLKTGFDGVYEWHKILEIPNVIGVNAITATQDGGFMIVGTIEITEGESKHTNIWVAKVNASGELEWQKNFGGRKNDVGKSIIAAKDGTFVILGNIGFEDTNMVGLIKVDKNGELVK